MNEQISRRELLRSGAILAAVLTTGASEALGLGQRKHKVILGCETYSLRDKFKDGTLTLEAVPALYKELGIQGISWNDMFFKSWDNAYLDKLKSAAKEAGRTTVCLIMEGNLSTADADKRRMQEEDDMMKLKAAAYLGCSVVRVNLGGTGSDQGDDTVGVERCVAAFNELLPVTKQHNIKITIENHGGTSKTADRVLKVINGTDPRWVGSCLDFGNWPAQPTELKYQEIEKLAPHAYHTHAKTHRFGPDGEESDIDYTRVLNMLRKANYTGAVSIEWEGNVPSDQVEGVKMTRDLVRKHWPGI
jgi:sugar phosphate isomerase/epimerase